MKISIITVCFNSAKTIRDTIESVKSQGYKNIEYIIVDGKSTDNTLDIVNEYPEVVSVTISERDSGIYDAMNKGIRAATGDIIGILNSDDFFASTNSIQLIAQAFIQNSSIDGVYGDLVYVKEQNINKISRLYSSKRFSKSKIRFGFMLPHPTFYIKKAKYDEFGTYKLDYRVAADFELIARHITKGIRLARIPHILIKMREGGISSSGLLWRIHQNIEISKACNSNGIRTSIFLIMFKLPFKLLSFFKK
ncbi:glycosyltransferase family 2 protein [Pseudoalteromonas arctica]|uniref:glycosyltransferase family 2 protein n=1 Tax=Pseudoalteromonas arctica TaxID=394751 RepID=UPI0024956A3D|nr:glycosyltransferase family 2 protein [Pseudoalteromonas arctica]